MTQDVADMKVSEPVVAPSKPAPDVSTSIAAKHEEEHEEETAEERAKREAELQKIYADLAKEDDRCFTILYMHCDQHKLYTVSLLITAKCVAMQPDMLASNVSVKSICWLYRVKHQQQFKRYVNMHSSCYMDSCCCREHMNIVFIGHVDAGKSTIGGQILYLTVKLLLHHLNNQSTNLYILSWGPAWG